ncbi:MAG: hypothetical protein LQ346_002876 [Caloplaca aetnensis]|nr:MAG: hypothetical protein LQ346_002876 [Caloplaca aetnensis]
MAPDVQESPFVKQLASSDRPTREKALESLRTYLSSNRQFTDIELLKLWKGLFFCLWHTPTPIPSQTLCTSLSTLLLALPAPPFAPFLRAFWITIISNYTSIPSLRLDKYLLLMRHYVRASFQYLKSSKWDRGMMEGWRNVMEGRSEGKERDGIERGEAGDELGPLSPGNMKVPDGVRYHVLDVWVDELVGVVGEDEGVGNEIGGMLMEPVARLQREGKGKIVKQRAREVLEDERVEEWMVAEKDKDVKSGSGEEEWAGFGD